MKTRLLYCLLLAMTFGLINVQAQNEDDSSFLQQPIKIGDEISVNLKARNYETSKAGVAFEKEFYSAKSTYIKLYFRNFDLAPGDYVEIYSPKTKESVIYAGKGKIVDNGEVTISDFWSQIIFSDKVIVKLHTVQASKGNGFDLDTVAYGYSPERIVEIQKEARQQAICGGSEIESIACYTGTEMFNKAKAVCRLVLNGSGSCTGWLLGCEGNIMTNNHCIGNASTARNTDFIFNFQTNSCNGGNTASDRVASSSTFIKTNGSVDATIVKLPTNPTDKYGYLSLRSAAARAGERIYIPQHPGGRRKGIAVKEGNGLAKIQSIRGSRDVQYLTDTEPGSSGSPVLAFDSNLVVAIHNTGGCPNGASGGNTRLISWLGSDMPDCGRDDDNTGVQLPVSKFEVAVNCNQITLSSESENATAYAWNFGDGNTSTRENPTHTYTRDGQYTVTLRVTNSAGANTTETTLSVAQAEVPRAVNESICEGESTSITLPGDKGYIWYDRATGGNVIFAGNTYETGVLNADKDYYVSGTSEDILEGAVGEKDINAASGGNHQGGFYLVFDAAENIILKKAKVVAQGAGNRTLELKNAAGTTIATKVINIPDGENVIDINLRIAAGKGLQIGFAEGANLFRSNAGLSFPYVYNAFNTDIVTIKGSTASDPTGFYYYLYNWEVNAAGNCETSQRAKVSVDVISAPAVPTIAINNATGVMTVDETYSSYQWFFNGNAINGATSISYTASQQGTYKVEVSNSNDCSTVSEDIDLSTLSNNTFELPAGVSVYPNPVNDVLNIRGLNTLDNVKELKVISMLGQTVKEYNLDTVLETTSIDVKSLSKGLYFLSIDNKYTSKFVVK